MKWVTDNSNEEMGIEMMEAAHSVDTILLGRTTYEILASHWSTTSTEKDDPKMINHMNNSAKIVFSKTLDKVEWNNSSVMREINVEEIQKLKNSTGKDIAIIGSASIVQFLMNLDLINEYQLLLYPLAIGNGKPLFKNLKDRHNLELLKTKALSNGVVILSYETKR